MKAQLTTPQRSPRRQGMTRWADRFFVQQQLREMNFNEPTFAQCPALLGAQPESPERANSLTPPGRMLKKKWMVPQVHWTPRSMLALVRRQKPLGAQPGHPLLRGATEGIVPCKGSVPRRIENFKSLRISALVSHCFEKPLKRMPFPIKIGIARLKTPLSEATMPPRSKKRCLHPWRGWPGTMPR